MKEARTALQEVHEGVYGSHSSGANLVKKLLRTGYYWSSMEQEAIHYSNKFLQCQQHGHLVHAPT